MKDIKKIAGQNIRRFRIKKGLTQVELADKAGITYKYLQKIEGKNPPNLKIDTIAKISSTLGVDFAKIVNNR
mgnify:CR=1 FL=1